MMDVSLRLRALPGGAWAGACGGSAALGGSDSAPRQSSAVQNGREFSFPDLERLTPDLTAHERLSVFLNLPVDLQGEAWRELGGRIERQSRARFAEERLGGWCTPSELAEEITSLWGECKRVPLGSVGELEARPASDRQHHSRPTPARLEGDLGLLRSIPSAEYVPLLTGREVNRHGFVQCPLHGGGDERTPSLHVSDTDGVWFCHACAKGGALLDFYAAVHDRQVPSHGAQFVAFVREVAIAIARGARWQ